jgi:hypothetical protein
MSPARVGSSPWWNVPVSLGAVCAFGLAQPLLDLLGRNPEFFIAQGFTSFDVALFPVPLLIVAPILMSLPVLALRLLGPRVAGIGHAIVIGAVFSLFVATTWIALWGSDGSPVLFAVVVASAGALFGVAYLALPVVRSAALFAGWAVPVFAAWFLLATPASAIALARSGDLPDPGEVGNPAPVVMVVFDEFPLATMIDSGGRLLSDVFPNFAALAADGVWYRNAVGVRQQTEEALPTILSGVGAGQGSIPIFSDHPLNLFTLLSGTYDIAAVETVTDLCPDFACSTSSRRVEPFADRWKEVGTDLAVVYGHLSTTRGISDGLPPIDQTWGDFTTGQRSDFDIVERFLDEVEDDRRLDVDRLLESLEFEGEKPGLRFGHLLYPHHPWEVDADGRHTGGRRPAGREGRGWNEDVWLVGQAYQQHIIQSQYADTIVGQVTERLRREAIYDRALVIVVADHGITIVPGAPDQRLVTEDTVGTIAAVPLFVKYPDGQEGVIPGTIDDVRAETVDLLPTITDVIDMTVPWDTDGMSLLDPERSSRVSSVMVGRKGPVRFGVDGSEKLAAAALKDGWFLDGDPWTLAPPGWRGWLGRPVSEAASLADDGTRITVRQQRLLDELTEGSDTLPVALTGTMTVGRETTGNEIVLVAVDGVVRAVTRVFDPDGRRARYEVLIPPKLLVPGANDVVLWLAEGTPNAPALSR